MECLYSGHHEINKKNPGKVFWIFFSGRIVLLIVVMPIQRTSKKILGKSSGLKANTMFF